MANIYVRSTDGSDADNGSTWALAKATLTGAAAIDAAGDYIYVSQAHAESTASAITMAFAGTSASPTRIICGNDGAAPPTAVATTATVSTTGNNAITLNNGGSGVVYVYGITFSCGSGANPPIMLLENSGSMGLWNFENCRFTLGGTSGGQMTVTGTHYWKNCTLTFSASAHSIRHQSGILTIEGGAVASGTALSNFMAPNNSGDRPARIFISGLDMSNIGTSCNIFYPLAGGGSLGVVRNCKLPASWSGSLIGTTNLVGHRYEMYNCDSGDTNYILWIEDFSGSVRQETTIIRTSGASDGTTSLSWKMASNASAEYPILVLRSPEIVQWNELTGSSKTVTVEFVHDTNVAAGQGAGTSSAFQDDEVWLEVMYLGTSGYPLGTWISDCKADVLATAADQAASSVTWTTTGMTTPVKQALSVTFTPQEKGYIHARICVGKASKTIYVDPLITVA